MLDPFEAYEFYFAHANWSLVPEHMRDGLARYIEHGVEPGGFMFHMLCNDLMRAAVSADRTNLHWLPEYSKFLALYAPSACHGSRDNVQRWMKVGGIYGSVEAHNKAERSAAQV